MVQLVCGLLRPLGGDLRETLPEEDPLWGFELPGVSCVA
jgi:hypothetical protein